MIRAKGNGLRVLAIARIFPLALLLACGGASTSTTLTNNPAPTDTSSNPCIVRAGGAPGPITDPNGPFFHQMAVARTTDGVQLADFRQLLEHASVPDGVRRADGTVLAYYVNGEMGSVWVASVTATAATPLGPILLNGISGPAGVVDPDAVLLSNGQIRLAYLSGFGPPGNSTPRGMCLADSSDGMNFTVVATAIRFPENDTTTDPSITRLNDGTWLMAMSRGTQTLLARSGDGFAFQTFGTVSFGGVPEITALPDGRVRLYVCARGIESYLSADRGLTWTYEASVVPQGTLGKNILCDPSWVPDAGLFIFKTAN